EAGLQSDVGVAHLAFDLGAGHQGRYRVDHQDIQGSGANQHVGDLEGLLTRVRLGDEQLVDVDADGPGVGRVEGVLGVDEGGDPAVALGRGHDVEGEAGLAGRLGTVDLDDPTPGDPAGAQGQVEREGSGGDDLHLAGGGIAHLHDGTLAVLSLDLGDRHVQ